MPKASVFLGILEEKHAAMRGAGYEPRLWNRLSTKLKETIESKEKACEGNPVPKSTRDDLVLYE